MMRIIFQRLCVCFLLLSLSGCAQTEKPPKTEKYRQKKSLMGTVVQLDVCYTKKEAADLQLAYEQVWVRLEDIHHRMSKYNDTSDVAKINSSFQNPVIVGQDTYRLLQDAMYFNRMTNGVFDITIGPLFYLWKKGADSNQLPTAEKINQAKGLLGPDVLDFLPYLKIQILKEGVKVDLAGIAKGYAIDEAARIFRDFGFKNFLIDAGGDLYLGGKNCENKPWRVGIKDPWDKTKIIHVVELENSAVATSGDYERYFEIQGKKWARIINPITGYPQEGIISATAIAPTAMEADVLATTLGALDAVKGMRFIETFGGSYVGMVVIEKEGKPSRVIESEFYKWYKAKDSN